MAVAAQLRLEVTCSICTDIYTSPVTLRCGHSFCQDCITKVFDSQHDREYFCPECMEGFSKRPDLKKNPRLSNIADHFHPVELKEYNAGNVCSYCISSSVPAVSLCLHCEAFLCDGHEQAHRKSPEHVLSDPKMSLEYIKCMIHKKFLEYYCATDDIFICAYCLTSNHNGHRVSTITELLQRKKIDLNKILEKMSSNKKEIGAMIQSLQEHKKKIHEKMDSLYKSVSALMKDIRRQQKELEKSVLTEISTQEQQISLSVSNQIQQLEKKKSELQKKIIHIEALSTNTNPLSALQTLAVSFCISDEKGDTDRTTGGKTRRDLEEARLLESLHSGLSNIMMDAGKKIQVQEIQQALPCAIYDDVDVENMSRAFGRVWSCTSSQTEAETIATSEKERAPEMLLDVNTASNYLLISDEFKTVSRSEMYLGRPETPERFQSSQVLSSRGISSGKHELEMQVSTTDRCSGDSLFIGMCYPRINRRGFQSTTGDDNITWGLWFNDLISTVIQTSGIKWLQNISSERIKIKVDYEAGKLSFYDPIQCLHTFTATFTEPLHLIISVQGNAWVKILKWTHQ